ncbi:MAG TPA: hypothetical protein DCR93_31910 [Cytophagales bacterium]|nr:hypothetical protein [Cytophagales bacterium]HAP63900.1 hypothetical protein [Cytophagales bacterium]
MKIVLLTLILSNRYVSDANREQNYVQYHSQITEAERLVGIEKYNEALTLYRETFASYDSPFLKDYKIATQIALHLGEIELAFDYLQKGILNGWTMKSINRYKYLKKLKDYDEWERIKKDYDNLHKQYLSTLNSHLASEMKRLFKEDRRQVFLGLFFFTSKSQDRFAENKYAPKSEIRIRRVIEIVNEHGYPGEKLVGSDLWGWGLLSHHNSISQKYTEQDSLYPSLRPKLLEGVQSGEMSPYYFAIIDEWYILVKSQRKETVYGYVDELTSDDLAETNELRRQLGIRSIEIRNNLIDIEKKTGMKFSLGPWHNGKITVANTL